MNPQQPQTLPEGWVKGLFKDLAIIEMGQSPEGETYNSIGIGVALLNGPTEFTDRYPVRVQWTSKPTKICKSGDILICVRGSSTGRINISNDEYCIGRGIAAVRANRKSDTLFLEYQLTFAVQQILRLSAGSTFPNIDKNSLSKIDVNIPPLPEQRQIAAVLGTWDRAIDQTTDLLKQLRTRHRGLMQRLLTGKVRLPGFDGEWRAVKLGDVFKERSQIGYHNLPLLSITAELGVVNQDELVKRDTSNEDKSKYKRICPGDIGYNTMRMWQGRSAVSSLEGIVSPAYTIITPKSNADVQFMGHLFKFPDMIHQFYRNSQGLVDDTLNCKFPEFAKVKVTIPSTINEQRAISQVLDASLREIRQQEAKLDALRDQKRGLMQCLLTGQVRVPNTVLTAQEAV